MRIVVSDVVSVDASNKDLAPFAVDMVVCCTRGRLLSLLGIRIVYFILFMLYTDWL